MRQDRRIFSARSGDRNFFALLKKVGGDDGVVNFGFEDMVKTFFAELLACLGPLCSQAPFNKGRACVGGGTVVEAP